MIVKAINHSTDASNSLSGLKKHIANVITGSRIIFSIMLLFFPLFSEEFWFLYLFCGFSDMIDGTVARKSNSISEFGAKLDSVADLVFVVAVLIKLLPIIHIPRCLWIWIVVIAIIKISIFIGGFIRKKKFISLHTIMNKITGLLLFLLPLTVQFIEQQYSCAVVCSVATFSALQEGYYIWTG